MAEEETKKPAEKADKKQTDLGRTKLPTNGTKEVSMDELGIKPVNIKGKPYILVSDRVKHAHAENDKISITTELVPDTGDDIVIKATVTTSKGVFNGYSYANKSKMIEKMSPYEVAETSAVGRALGFAGYGIIDSIASADEMVKAGADKTDYTNIPDDPQRAKSVFWAKFYALKDYAEAQKLLDELDKSKVADNDKFIIRKKIIEKRNTLAAPDFKKLGVEIPAEDDVPF